MKDQMDKIYGATPLDKVPWNVETPPAALVELVEKGKASPCKAVDLGCGAGNYVIYLASKGFDMTGIDIAPAAIKLAKQNAKKKGIQAHFVVQDILGSLDSFRDTFDLAYDWEVLHHIFPEQRQKYVTNVAQILRAQGKYLSVCFSEKDPQFGGTGKYRKTNIGTQLYFSSETELRTLFEPHFTILELKTIEIVGKTAPHIANYVFMERR